MVTTRPIFGLAAIAILFGGAAARAQDSGDGEAPRELWVAATGNDDGPGSKDRPWKSLTKALAQVQPGDTVTVRAGTYGASSTAQWEPAFHPARGGTAERPILVRALPGETVVLRNEATRVGESYPAPAIGAVGRDHVSWEGFTLGNGDRVVILESRGVEIRDCTVSGVRPGPGHPGNVDAIWIQRSADCAVRRCRLRDVVAGDRSDSNGAGVKLYSTERVVVEGCEIAECGSGIHDKEQGPGARIRGNRITNCFVGVRIGMQKGPTRDVEITGNLIRDAEVGVYAAVPRAEGWGDYRIRGNTIVRAASGVVSLGVEGVLVEDNAFYEVQVPLDLRANVGSDPVPIRSDHNAFHRFTEFRTDSYTAAAKRFATLAAWRSASGNDRASLESDPGFVDAAKGDYRLRKDSPLRRAGRGGSAIGAFVD